MSLHDLCMIVKLTTGDTLLCQVLSDTEDNILIRDVLQIKSLTSVTEDGVKSMTYYSPWFQGTESNIHMVRKIHVLSAAIPDETTKVEYSSIIDQKVSNPDIKKKSASLDELNFGSASDKFNN